MVEKHIYHFSEGGQGMRAVLGGKGAGLAEMTRIGLPVPPGFTISTAACREYYEQGDLPAGLMQELTAAVQRLELETGKKFGDPTNPLLVSVRSGAEFSMPGMMDTILNLGLNDEVAKGLAARSNEKFALDCYRRFIEKFAELALQMPASAFSGSVEELKFRERIKWGDELSLESLRRLVAEHLTSVHAFTGQSFPSSPHDCLQKAIKAVFASWQNERAKVYRRLHQIPDSLGTAVTVQAMVFGNLSSLSGTGVCFTRNPSTGEKQLYGEFLAGAQGEDVVSGARTPADLSTLKSLAPSAFAELQKTALLLESHYGDMQDIEFTVEEGRLYLLQTRVGKRSPQAAISIAMDMLRDGKIEHDTLLSRITPEQIEQLLHRSVDYTKNPQEIATGLPASPGAAVGVIAFDNEAALRLTKTHGKVILVRPETSPDDIQGMITSQGILTSRGGMTSHAAVVARGMGKPCVSGADALNFDLSQGTVSIGKYVFKEGDELSLDGSTGKVFLGAVPLVEPRLNDDFWALLCIADQKAALGVRANADNPLDAALARRFGAKGIGLCRTEHMFMEPGRLPIVQAMIMAEHEEDRERSLQSLLPVQRHDFYGIMKAMDGYPVTIRLLDPPLHEFLPSKDELKEQIVHAIDPRERIRSERALRTVERLHEINPMLGHRGCRLGITFPSIYAMQVEAIAEATFDLLAGGHNPQPEIMIPLVAHHRELLLMRRLAESTWHRVELRRKMNYPVPIGSMIEVPRACLVAGEIALHADFFSFGTNDLTQTTFGFSRDDAEGKFLPSYVAQDVLPQNPFAVLDIAGVGQLMRLAVKGGREAKPSLKVGICGEHGGEPASIKFCHELGLDYVSCSPYRVPVARLATARAKAKDKPESTDK
ncbi:MAG: Pyruvate, phosphate dikinase [Firmicutes bacterium]|nr:Pyruvate, phosphate dikinase [Bacillota bacterium]